MNVFGIDFGTTNSAAVKLTSSAEPQKYGDDTGRPLPSIVALDKATGEAIGGRQVWENRERYAESEQYHLIGSVKWKLGTDEVWQTEEGVWTAEDVAAFVLSSLSLRAAELGVEPIRRAAITIPVDFPPRSRTSLRNAAAKAGIEVATFITESTAALIKHVPQLRHCRNIAVFDWGGGTLDISILEIRDNCVFELATDGMDLAGDSIDLDFARAIHHRVMEERRESIPFESMPAVDRDTLLTKCERAKCQFEKLQETDIVLTSYGGSPVTLRSIQRSWFESIIGTHVDLAIELLSRTVRKARLSPSDINRLLVVGGSARLRLLHERLRADPRFGAAFYSAEDAEWDVAYGAAVLQSSGGGYETAESLGILLSDNTYYEIVQPGSRVDTNSHSLNLSLIEDAREANIVVAKRNSKQLDVERVLAFGVGTLGFDLEAITLQYSITGDLVFRIQGESASVGPSSRTTREYGRMRFAYHL
jgi:molecular chaperone DnaK